MLIMQPSYGKFSLDMLLELDGNAIFLTRYNLFLSHFHPIMIVFNVAFIVDLMRLLKLDPIQGHYC